MFVAPAPYIKPKKCVLNPIPKFGIPKYADAVANPKVADTPEYQKYWEEQLYYIMNGYTSHGMTIPGRYYYYLNFGVFGKVSERVFPDVCDLHLELAHYIEYCKKEHKNFISPKKRRGGVTEAFLRMVIDYGWRFDLKYKAGIAAGLDKHLTVFMKKWKEHDALIIPEFRIKSISNTEEKIAQYEIKKETGFVKQGTFNTILSKTAFQNSNIFKGEELNDIVAEESGEFDKIIDFFSDSEDCMMFGANQQGNFWAWGTGGRMSGASKHFEAMWHNYEDYNMVRFFIPAPRFYPPYYGGASEKGNLVEIVPNFKHLTPNERIGVEDIEAATEHIKARREKLLKKGNIKKYTEFCQNNPFTIDEVFKRTVSNKFDINILNEVGMKVSGEMPRYTKYTFSHKKNEKGEVIVPIQLELIPAKDKDPESECVLIADDGEYIPGSSQLYCAGIDSYDLDTSNVSKSLGAMVVFIRDNNYPNAPKKKVIALIRCRPKRKEVFFSMCLCLATHYNLIGSVLIDVANNSIFEYFKSNGGRKFLAKRPVKFESEKSEQTHEFGVRMTGMGIGGGSKGAMVALMQTYILDYGLTIPFIKLIEELQNYNEIEKESDNDSADAFGYALMQDVSMQAKPQNDEEKKKRDERFNLNDDDYIAPSNLSQDHDRFGYS